MKRYFVLGLVIGLASSALAQPAFIGQGRYPQFRSYSGLPGGGFSVGRDGRPSPTGALAYSSPIAYSLAPWTVNVGLGAVGTSRSPSSIQFGRSDAVSGSGTAWGMIGLPGGRFGRFTVTHEILSSVNDSAINIHWQLPVGNKEGDKYSFAVGVQDIDGSGGSAGEGQATDFKSSTTLFAVYTRELKPGWHMSLGTGTRRFEGIFGSTSYSIGKGFQLFAEHDSFNFNYGVGYNIMAPQDDEDFYDNKRRAMGSITLGLSRSSYLFGGFSLTF